MKRIILFAGLLVSLFYFSCEKDLHSYIGKPVIYFNEAGRLPIYQGEVIKDSTVISLGLSDVSDSTVNMVIKVMGETAKEDRPYELIVNSNSTAIEGVHYEIKDKSFAIQKNQLTDTVRIKFLKNPVLEGKSVLLSFGLKENAKFSVEMQDKVLNTTTGKRHSFVNYRWFFDDIVSQPSGWFEAYMGKFSKKKMLLMAEVLNIKLDYLNERRELVELLAFGKYMQRYLNDQRSAGNVILDEDNNPMIMGAGVQ